MRDLSCMGVRTDDWMTVCKDQLSAPQLERIVEEVYQRAASRNRFENERNRRLHLDGGCATHRD